MPNREGSRPAALDAVARLIYHNRASPAPVRDKSGALDDHPALPSHPDGNGAPKGQGIDPRIGDAVPLPFERHELFRPQRTHERDLFLDALAPVLEILSERLEFDRIPPDSDSQAEPASRKHVHRRGLFRHQRGLPLRKNHDARDQLDAPGDGGQEPEQDEGLVKHVPVRVWALPTAGPLGVRSQHVIEREDVRVAHGLHSLRVVANHRRVLSDLYLREDDADVHRFLLDSD